MNMRKRSRILMAERSWYVQSSIEYIARRLEERADAQPGGNSELRKAAEIVRREGAAWLRKLGDE